jgi:hypothetical protein
MNTSKVFARIKPHITTATILYSDLIIVAPLYFGTISIIPPPAILTDFISHFIGLPSVVV